MTLPQVESSDDQTDTTIAISIRKDNQIVVGGDKKTLNEVTLMLARLIERKGDDPSLISIVLRADRESSMGVTNRLISEVNDLGIQKLTMGTELKR